MHPSVLPPQPLHQVIPDPVLRALLRNQTRLGRAARIAAGSGARVSEIASLHSHDIDPRQPFILLQRAEFNRPGTKGTRDPQGRSTHRRLVRIPSWLHRHLLRRSGWLFPSPHPNRPHLTTRTLQLDLIAWCRRRNIRLTWHDFRHTYATRLAAVTGWNFEILALQLGHQDEKTSRIYTHIPPEVWDAWLTRLTPQGAIP